MRWPWETMEEDERSSEAWPLGPRNHHLFVLMVSCVQQFLWPLHLKTLNNWQLTAYVNIAFLMMCSWTITCRIISLWQVKTKNFEPWHQYQCRGWIWTNQLPPPATVPCAWQGFIPTLQVSWGFIFAETKSSGKTCIKGLWGSRGLWSNARPIHYDKISQKALFTIPH